MSILGKAFKTITHTMSTPVDVIKDIVTLGGVITGEEEPHTIQKIKKIIDDIDELGEEIDDL